MLELKGIYKTYKSKKGSSCTALKNINIKFPDNGMVFILGKSGSGKSTLLNVIGGLDAVDKGEIIIKDKSSKDFTQRDYDSYRNTYLGFIFQEYNVMDDFNVYDNVALALRLQGKREDKKSIEEILKTVDLVGYEKRKPNELSGGQKQRVAIARALVKNPEIIFGDEPTGNLDSKTSAQIFDCLKKLSKEKLVVIVSHDRESAERYADRIIELSDGRVISDAERSGEPNEFKIDGDKIYLPYNRSLTQEEVTEINASVNSGKMTFVRSESEFVKTKRVKNNNKEPFKLIKSKLPNRYACSIGTSNFKKKKFRLVVTIFLTVISLAMFGISQTFGAYDLPTASATSFEKNSVNKIILKQGEYNEEYGSFNNAVSLVIPQENVDKITSATNKDINKMYGVEMSLSRESSLLQTMLSIAGMSMATPYATKINGVLVADEDVIKGYFGDYTYLYGSMPDADSTKVLITDYLADSIIKQADSIATTREEVMNYGIIDIFGNRVEVAGIIDTDYEERYEDLIKTYVTNNDEFTSHDDYGAFTTEVQNYLGIMYSQNADIYDYFIDNFRTAYVSRYKFKKETDEKYSKSVYTSGYMFRASMMTTLSLIASTNLSSRVSGGENFESILNADENNIYISTTQYESLFGTPVSVDSWTADNERVVVMGQFSMLSRATETDKERTFNVVGVYNFGETYNSYVSAFISDEMSKQINEDNFGLKALYLELGNNVRANTSFLNLVDSLYMYHVTELSNTIYMVSSIFKIFAIIFRWIALILGIFSVILLFNFVALSVINKQKDIGILRAIGCKGWDVAKIFLFESLIVGAITVVVAWGLMFLGVWGINSLLTSNFRTYLQSDAINRIALLQVGFVPMIAVLGACLLVTFIATILPIIRISRMKPVDAIKKIS